MSFVRHLLMHMFGRPKGLLGWLGGLIMARANRDAAVQAVEILDVRPDDNVMEVGFGPGIAIQLLSERAPGGWIAGVDQSQEMIKQAAARNSDALRNRSVDLRYGSAERLPFADETFDKVLAINSMQVMVGRARGTAGNPSRHETRWQSRPLLHGQLWSTKEGYCRAPRYCWICAGADSG